MSSAVSPVPFTTPEEIESALPAAIAHVRSHRILAYPTETVYGFGGSIDQQSVDALIRLKDRPANRPILLLISSDDMLLHLDLHLPPYAELLASQFWPGPLTLVLPGGTASLPATLRGPEGGIAVRWTSHAGILRLIGAYNAPITSTSANHHGVAPAASAQAISDEWHHDIARGLIYLLDGGSLVPSLSSTVVDCMGSRPRLIRSGAIPVTTLREAAPALIATPDL